jgi:DNA-directed RNA polymerase subunit M/transcription elongation factor TFIIS
MKFCQKCGSLYFLKKATNDKLIYDCRNCGTQEPRNISDNCSYQSDIEKKEYMTYQRSKNPDVIRDPTLPRLSNVKCINGKCLTNQQLRQLVLVNSINCRLTELKRYLEELAESPIELIDINAKDITEFGEIHTSIGNYSILEKEILLTNPIKLLVFQNSLVFKKVVDNLLSNNGSNLIPDEYIIDNNNNVPILSEILREIISIKYDEINMKYMYICSTCGSSWKNIT